MSDPTSHRPGDYTPQAINAGYAPSRITPAKQMAGEPTQDEVALFVMSEKARAWRDQPDLSEDQLKDEVMMRLARKFLAIKAQVLA